MVYLYLAIFGARDTHITVVTVHYYFLADGLIIYVQAILTRL